MQILQYMFAALAVDTALASTIQSRQSSGCDLKQIKILQKSLNDPLLFCMWWRGNKNNRTPFASLNKKSVDGACKCIFNTPSLGNSTMPAVEPSNPQVKDLATLQNSVAAPLPFCQVWSKATQKDASPFSKVNPASLNRLCTAIIKNPKLVAPKGRVTSSSSKTSSQTSPVTVTTSISSVQTTISTTGSSTTPSATPNTDPIFAPQVVMNPLLLRNNSQNYTNRYRDYEYDVANWESGSGVAHGTYQLANSSQLLHAVNLTLGSSKVYLAGKVNATSFGSEDRFYLGVVFWDGWCNDPTGCHFEVTNPNGYSNTYPGFQGTDDFVLSTTMSGYPKTFTWVTTITENMKGYQNELQFRLRSYAEDPVGVVAQVSLMSVALYGPVGSYEDAMRILGLYNATSSIE
ncbi:Hypothetical protein D9617_14g077720 [Elsinoe fawcettii]|nr:Hypothetical protein D9617_14g077720 [Elsinoe fawcettii]